MGVILSYFRIPRSLDTNRIRSVWYKYISDDDTYFQERNDGIRAIIMSLNCRYAESEEEQMFVLCGLADRISIFFHQLIDDQLICDQAVLRKSCYELGRQHIGFGKRRFNISYWEQFTLTMMDVLESSYPDTTKEEQKAWHSFLRFINENMLEGYLGSI